MKRALGFLIILSSMAAVQACLIGPCPMVDCADFVRLRVQDSQGRAVSAVAGTVTIDGRVFTVACGGADAGVAESDGGTDAGAPPDRAHCIEGEIILFTGAGANLVSAELRSGNLAFQGEVPIATESKQVGPAHCNTHCVTREGLAILR